MRGEWIEMSGLYSRPPAYTSLPMRGEWIEITPSRLSAAVMWSLPMRGEWIEMGAEYRAQRQK